MIFYPPTVLASLGLLLGVAGVWSRAAKRIKRSSQELQRRKQVWYGS